MMYLDVGLFVFILFGTLCASWTCMSFSSIRLGKFLVTISLNRFDPLFSLFSFWYPYDVDVVMLHVSKVPFLKIFFFFFSDLVFSNTLSSKSMIQSSASTNLLFILSSVFFISDWLFFMISIFFFHGVVVLTKFLEHPYNHFFKL